MKTIKKRIIVNEVRGGAWVESEIHRGIEYDGVFLDLDFGAGDYLIIEHLITNAYGFYDGRGSTYSLFRGAPREARKHFSKRCICGTINIVAGFTYKNNRISRYTNRVACNIVRLQG